MGAMASHITSLTIVYSTIYSGADQRKQQSSASSAFVNVVYPVHKIAIKIFAKMLSVNGKCIEI